MGTTNQYPNHGLYATYITGSVGDYLVISGQQNANYAFYDGLVKSNGAVTDPKETKGQFIEPVGSVAEVKTQHLWLRKFLMNDSPYKDLTPRTLSQQARFAKLITQINIYSQVAEECGLRFFISFDNREAGLAGREIFEYRKPTYTQRPVTVHFLPPEKGLYPST